MAKDKWEDMPAAFQRMIVMFAFLGLVALGFGVVNARAVDQGNAYSRLAGSMLVGFGIAYALHRAEMRANTRGPRPSKSAVKAAQFIQGISVLLGLGGLIAYESLPAIYRVGFSGLSSGLLLGLAVSMVRRWPARPGNAGTEDEPA